MNPKMMELAAKRTEMKGQQDADREFELKMEVLSNTLAHILNGITAFDEMTVRQLVSSIKVLDKERLLVCFRDGEQIVVEKN